MILSALDYGSIWDYARRMQEQEEVKLWQNFLRLVRVVEVYAALASNQNQSINQSINQSMKPRPKNEFLKLDVAQMCHVIIPSSPNNNLSSVCLPGAPIISM